jgi:lipopolysaccharide/colanic/teichoic acid biosynthesis glycosyltransferase
MTSAERSFKFFFDRLVAAVGLVVLSPLLLILGLAVKVFMGKGPVLFKQQRVGKDGKLFTIVKFRTMEVGHGGCNITVEGEDRIYPFGAVLRKLHLDEMPELWNVLKGEMSFVGPRPDVPGYADNLSGPDREILRLRPGITGPATLKYRDEEHLLASQDDPWKYNDEVIFPDKVRINRYYIDHFSFLEDIRIIFATITGRRILYGGEMI